MTKHIKIGLALGLAGVVASVSGCDSSKSSEQDPRLRNQLVRVAQVQPAASSERSFTGLIAARVQSNLTFRVAGKVVARLVDTGQSVHAGQPLMRIDRTDFDNVVAAQQGNVAAAKAKLTQTEADEARYRTLVGSGAVSKSAYDQVKAANDSARAFYDAAEAQLKVAENDGRYATLLADADGVVMETLAEPGQFVAAGQVVMRLAQSGPREASVYLPETLRPAIGSAASASLYGLDGHFNARLRQLSDTADPITRTFEARYVLDGKASGAPLGSTVTVHIPTAELANDVVVPLGAIDDRGAGPGVWVVSGEPATVSYHHVSVERLESEQAILSGDLRTGETVVAMGGYMLHEGEGVRLAEKAAVLK